jgi:serine/threonine protein kinase HipA of HipAB toxin-antitoxin module
MSRTRRLKSNNPCQLRAPRTTAEIRQLVGLLADLRSDDLAISGINRIHRRTNIPTAWDDIVCSGYRQIDYGRRPWG